jgi:HSP20 family protein
MSRHQGSWPHWSPAVLDDVRKELGRLFEGVFEGDEVSRGYSPSTNVAETEKGYEVSIDLPGVKANDVNIEFKDGQLWISGERKPHAEEKGKTFHRIERRFGLFRRVIPLGTDVDVDAIGASFKDGVLVVDVPKVPAARSRRIEVKS